MKQDAGSKKADSSILDSLILDSFRRFWLFFRRDAFVADAQGKSFVQRVHEGSATYAREISDKLKELVYTEVMPEIAAGFIAYRRERMGIHVETEESLHAIYQASLSLLYKLLFLLYAEARGLLPVDNPGYREQSLTALAQWAADRRDRNLPLSTATHATPKYEALLALFRRIDQGDPSLGIPRYNGGLFNPKNPDNAFLERHRLSDRAVACAVDILVRDAGQPVDYAYISVRNLGAIYEGLLENKLVVEKPDRSQKTCQVSLVNDKGERKATGSYYTPDYIVEYIVQQTLGPILEARAETFAAAMERVADVRRALGRTADPGKVRLLRGQLDAAERDAREAFLGIKVLDPAMGSGHFLVNAVDFLTDGIIQRMQTFHDDHPAIPWEWNPIQQLVERVRAEILDEMARQGIAVDPARLDDTALLTRLVMKRCIYGVDLNKMAVELAKLSLWLHSFTVGAPLSFLDHHLRWGNSLIGTDVRTVEAGIQMTDAGQFGLFAGPFAGLLDLTALMVEVVDRADATLSDVQRSAGDYERFQRALIPYKQALDLWVSQYFGNKRAAEFVRENGHELLPALRGEKQVKDIYQAALTRARELWEEKRFFHWDLEFPEVFVDLRKRDWAENPGFDAVIGNPPWGAELEPQTKVYLMEKLAFVHQRTPDTAKYFTGKALLLTRPEGYVSFIVPNNLLFEHEFLKLRQILLNEKSLCSILDLGDDVFSDAIVPSCVFVVCNTASPNNSFDFLDLRKVSKTDTLEVSKYEPESIQSQAILKIPGMTFQSSATDISILQKAYSLSNSLGNLAQEVSAGIGTGGNSAFLLTEDEAKSQKLEEDIIYPILIGEDIYRFYVPPHDTFKRRILYVTKDFDPKTHPNVMKRLAPFQSKLARKRETVKGLIPWYSLHWPRYPGLFEAPKLVFRQTSDTLIVTLDTFGYYILNSLLAIQLKPKYKQSVSFLLSILNSSLLRYIYGKLVQEESRVFAEVKPINLRKLPIPRITFTTPAAERARLLAEGQALARTWVQQPDAAATAYATFLASPFGAWLNTRLPAGNQQPASSIELPASSNQSDVVHDLLASLAEEMLALNRDKQTEMRGFLAWLERHIGAKVDDLTGKTDIQGYLGDYQKGESPLTFNDLLKRLRQNRRKLSADPDARAFQETLEREYTASLEKLLPLKRRLAATDRLIDLIIYRLYGLTEDEVEIVES